MDHPKPLLLIDVDGVLNPDGKMKASKGWTSQRLAGYKVSLHPKHGEWLNALADRYELVWASTWEDEANEHIAPLLGLSHLPVIKFTEEAYASGLMTTWKLLGVQRYVGDQPFAWIDDDIWPDSLKWGAARNHTVPTLILKVDPRMGLMEHHIKRLEAFADGITP